MEKSSAIYSPERQQTLRHIVNILEGNKPFAHTMQLICDAIAGAYISLGSVSVRIGMDDESYETSDFKASRWIVRKDGMCMDNHECFLEIHFPADPKPLQTDKQTEDYFFSHIMALISGIVSKHLLEILTYQNTERLKELEGLKKTRNILNQENNLEESLQKICMVLPEAWQYPEYTAALIRYDEKVFKSRKFKPTPWLMKQSFETPDKREGTIEIYYLKEFPPAFDGPFLEEEISLIDNLAALISGTASKKALSQLLYDNTERLKELQGINQTTHILKQGKSIEESLQIICSVLPEAWQYPEYTAVRIIFEKKVFCSQNFRESPWVQRQKFEAPGHKKGVIEIFYLKEFPMADEGPFLKEERNLLINLSNLIAGSAFREVFTKLMSENKERLKELWAINQTSQIIARGFPLEETLQRICSLLPKSWQYPKYTAIRIRYQEKEYTSADFQDTVWSQKEHFVTVNNKKGSIEVFYLRKFPEEYEGPFLKEERNLLINISKLISGYLNDLLGREYIRMNFQGQEGKTKSSVYREFLTQNENPLQLFFNKQILDKYIYLDMMKFKVKEILFVATLYDAFMLQSEESFFEQFMGEIYQYSLFSLPRITAVTSSEEALDLIDKAHFDIVILMSGLDRETPLELSYAIKQKQSSLQVYMLINQKSDISYFEELVPRVNSIDKLFIWNGHSQIFFAIVKLLEDKINVENDTKIGLVRIILLVEDSAYYYSKYLQILYSIVFGQVQQLLPEAEKNELDKIAKMRSRPKILLARNYEDALFIFNKYKDFLLCVISDVEFEREGKMDKTAGIKFIRYIKSHMLNLPIVLQSSDDKNKRLARELEAIYMNKNSETLLTDLKQFLIQNMGFGDFVFRDKEGNVLSSARSLREFEQKIKEIPDESFYLHASENQFSLWLMARGEIQLARTLNPMRIGDFSDIRESRAFFEEQLKQYKAEKKKGKILTFDETSTIDEYNIITFAGGSLGGKGRGLAFINALINNLGFSQIAQRINISTPKTVIIGTDEFEYFIEHNNLYEKVLKRESDYFEIRKQFAEAHLSTGLMERLKVFLEQIDKPIAVRSSSLLEDSVSQPFAGIFDTYVVPYTGANKRVALTHLSKTIKLVFASIFSDNSKAYFRAIHHKTEEEKMGIALQELVGNPFGDYYYPHISGIAQSYNYYPLANMNPDEGFAVIALGLGAYVVGGNNSFRFSPKYPRVDMYTTKDLLNSAQVSFYALDFSKKTIDYVRDGELASYSLLDVREAENHGTLKHLASVYNAENDQIEAGISKPGRRILNFADILKYNYIPLADTITLMLETIKDSIGSPVEIEFAVDLNPGKNNLPTFYLLQIKPLVGYQQLVNLNIQDLDKASMIVYSESALGNGEINDLTDIIYVDPKKFDKLKTMEMVAEMEYMNELMNKKKRHYILIGPGRWGTSDRFLGIPVNWRHISNARVIIETSLANFPLDSSLGSHFFHNVTSMNIGYFSVQDSSRHDFIRWDLLEQHNVNHETTYFKHICFNKPIRVVMNGRSKTAAILNNTM